MRSTFPGSEIAEDPRGDDDTEEGGSETKYRQIRGQNPMSPTPSLGERERERRRQIPNPANRGRRVPTPDETADGDDVSCFAALHKSRRVHFLRHPKCAVIPTDGVSSLLWN
ncbi:hypothetical protein U1Q18_008216 [Sarracenia purpurea var. burkii]